MSALDDACPIVADWRYSRNAARKAHPDKGGSEAKMAAVNEAYEVLNNPGQCLAGARGHGRLTDALIRTAPTVRQWRRPERPDGRSGRQPILRWRRGCAALPTVLPAGRFPVPLQPAGLPLSIDARVHMSHVLRNLDLKVMLTIPTGTACLPSVRFLLLHLLLCLRISGIFAHCILLHVVILCFMAWTSITSGVCCRDRIRRNSDRERCSGPNILHPLTVRTCRMFPIPR